MNKPESFDNNNDISYNVDLINCVLLLSYTIQLVRVSPGGQ